MRRASAWPAEWKPAKVDGARRDLSRPGRCRYRTRRHRTGAQRRMQRSGDAAGGQGRPDRRRLRARRFFNCHGACGVGRWRVLGRRRGRRTGCGGYWFADGSRGGGYVVDRGRLLCISKEFAGHARLGRLIFLAKEALPDQLRNRLVHRAGVSLLFCYSQVGKHFEDGVRRNLELPCQLVDANFAHKYCNTRVGGRLADLLRVLYGIKFSFGI